MKFCWCTIAVRNMEESLKFYQEIVGLSINRRFMTGPGSEIAFLGDGETKIELIHNEGNESVNIGHDISIGFEVNSVDERIKFIKEKGLDLESGPFQPNPHVKFFFVKDPNGVRVQFVENL
ncbi:VOC family protein [Geosporobacter ferrireducens]|uniref:Glyoxalase n=1 Tax=Geosporobacter ferrireducens TaxID=1424294 RepID=A0A1D8GM22_9FIRM|nr:VOC family protein [Geosporobacter ferrireducens]AOT71959.1 glyoxalase [Geosporobacter ferrireducens]MTI55826.1 VOC family protein [Geosporobacter ferrireducens]